MLPTAKTCAKCDQKHPNCVFGPARRKYKIDIFQKKQHPARGAPLQIQLALIRHTKWSIRSPPGAYRCDAGYVLNGWQMQLQPDDHFVIANRYPENILERK